MQESSDLAKDIKQQTLHHHVEKARAQGYTEELLSRLIELGRYYLDQGDAPKALTQFEEGLKVCETASHELYRSRLFGLQGMALRDLGNFDFALKAFRKSLRAAKAINHQILQCDALTHIASITLEKGKSTEAIGKLDQAYGLALQAKDRPRSLNITLLLGRTFLQLDNPDKALEYLNISLENATQLPEKDAEGRIRVDLANLYMAEGLFEDSIEQLEAVLEIADALEDWSLEMTGLNLMMIAQGQVGNARLASLYGEQLIHHAHQREDPLMKINALRTLGNILASLEKFPKATLYLERGLERAKELDDRALERNLLASLAQIEFYREEWESAAQRFQAALDIDPKEQDPSEQAYLLGRLSAAQAEKGELDLAIENAQLALSISREIQDLPLIGEQLTLLAMACLDQGQKTQARDYCREAIQTYKTLGDDARASKLRGWMNDLNNSD